jgi:hypothetical protein
VLGGALARDDVAVGECLGPGHVVEVPMAQHDRDVPHAVGLQQRPDAARVVDGDVRVVDDGLVAGHDRVARDPERERSLVDPVRLRGEAMAGDPAVIEGVDVGGRTEDPQVLDHRAASVVASADHDHWGL